MISTDKEFETEAYLFFLKAGKDMESKYCFNFESEALDYIKNCKSFKYRDDVEAGVLVGILEKFGFIKFDKKEGNNRFHHLTEEGVAYLNSKK